MNLMSKSLLALATGIGIVRVLQTRLQPTPLSFRGKSIIITGGSRGLGLVMARMLAAEGANLTILARDADEITRAAHELTSLGARVLAIQGDVRDRKTVQDMINRAIAQFGRVDVLINNAGVIQAGPIEHMTVEDFEDALAIHVCGPIYATLAVLPHMRLQGGGRIVNVSSIGGQIAVPHLVPYCTSKFALAGFSDGLRAELAKDKIRVTTVYPGLMRTGSHVNALFKGQYEQEYLWFSLLDSLPITSIDARRAGRQIIEACRRGESRAVISIQAQLLLAANALVPGLVAEAMKLMTWFLPGPTSEQGNVAQTGWESRSSLSPSLLTRLADQATVANNGLKGGDTSTMSSTR